MKWILVVLSFFSLNYTSAQIRVDDIWPVLKKVDKNYVNSSKDTYWIFAGAVQGDCKNGDGVYFALQQIKHVYDEDYRSSYRMACKIWKGHFSDNGKYFTGTRYYVEIDVTQKKEKADCFPEQKLDLNDPEHLSTWADYIGHFKSVSPASQNFISYYRPDGEMRDVEKERKYGYPQYSGVFTYGLDA